MVNRKSDATFMPRSRRAWILALLGTATLALSAAGPAGANPDESARIKTAVPGDLLDTTLHPMFRRPCGTSPHGTRRHIPDPSGGPDTVLECVDGTWVAVD